jgi:alginate O-acetyltransferase complex protein AlgJ
MMPSDTKRRRNQASSVRNALFALCLGVPLMVMLTDRKEEVPFPMPTRLEALFDFSSEFKHYFSHGFALRKPFARIHERIMAKVGSSSRMGGVGKGADGWLFLAEAGLLDDYRRKDPLERSELEALKTRFEANNACCQERNIAYFLLIVPAKETIVPDKLPDGILPRRAGTSRAEYAQRFLRTKSLDLDPIDLVAPLRANRFWHEPYFKTDTHWNEIGAFVAYQELLKRMRLEHPNLSVPSREAVSVAIHEILGGNEAQILGVEDRVDEVYPTVTLPDARRIRRTDGEPLTSDHLNRAQFAEGNFHTQCDEGELRSALVFHDSFGLATVKFIGRNFRDTRFIWGNFDGGTVDQFLPEVVIQVIWVGHL